MLCKCSGRATGTDLVILYWYRCEYTCFNKSFALFYHQPYRHDQCLDIYFRFGSSSCTDLPYKDNSLMSTLMKGVFDSQQYPFNLDWQGLWFYPSRFLYGKACYSFSQAVFYLKIFQQLQRINIFI